MKKIFRIVALLVIVAMVLPYAIIQAADTTLTASSYAFVTSNSPDVVSTGSTYTLTPYETKPSAAYYNFNIKNLVVPEGKVIGSAEIKMQLYKNAEYTDGDLLVRSCDTTFASNSLSYNTAPEYGNYIGKKSNLSITASRIDRIDITPYISECINSGKDIVSFVIFNYGNADCKLKVTGLEITFVSSSVEFNVGKAKFYKNNISEKNYMINGEQGLDMWTVVPVSGNGNGSMLNITIASYTKDGAVNQISQFEKRVYSGSEKSIISFPFIHSKEAAYTRAFVWDSNQAPYVESSYYTEKSVAELSDVSVSCGKLAPRFRSDVYEYAILFDELPENFPEINIQYVPGMNIKKIPTKNINEPYVIEVTSADYNKTVRYSFTCKINESVIISSHKAETKNAIISIPDEYAIDVNEGATFVFDKNYVYGDKSAVSDATFSVWAKASESDTLEIYTDNSLKKLINRISVVPSEDYTRYDIPVHSAEFSNINSIDLFVKGNVEIWAGENGVESASGKRIPYITVNYGKTDKEKENTLFWDDRTKEFSGYFEYDTLPYDKYLSAQNPPTFVWPYVDFADSYQFIVARDEEFKDVVAYKNDITLNLQTFAFEFEPGNYYWKVRAVKDDEYTEWTDVRRVTVLSDAVALPVPDVDYISDALKSAPHPRILTTPEKIVEFRGLKDKGVSSVYESIISDADAAVTTPYLYNADRITVTSSNLSTFISNVTKVTDQIQCCAYAYLITGESKYGTTGVRLLKHVASWKLDADGGNTSYEKDSQMYRAVLYGLTIGYDSLFKLLTDTEKTLIENSIVERMVYLEHPSKGLQDAAYRLEYTPAISHGWSASEAILAAATVMAGHSESAYTILEGYLPRYLAMNATQTGYQDGGFSGGFAYSTYDSESYVIRALNNLGIYDMTKSAQYRNLWKNYFYTVFNLTAMEFGDGSYGWGANYDSAKLLRLYARYSQSPYAVWKYNSIKLPLESKYENYFIGVKTDVEPIRPTKLPKSYAFRDSGYVAMHSDLENEDKISLYFRSSPYGSAAHAHADNNSFHIQAFGERLAIDSGYYDTVSTKHSINYKRETYAHNAVTHSGGKGQANKTLQAKGKITNFITGEYFDLTSGDATETYNYYNGTGNHVYYDKQMDKAVRHIIYIRPDYFIVIDDLKAADSKETTFEWWLNAYEDINFSEDKNGAVIRKNEAELEAEILYPSNINKGGKSEDFTDINGNVWPAEGSYSYLQKHQRVWFVTPPVNQTGIVSVINVRKRDDDKKEYDAIKYSDYIKITFPDGTVAYIRTTNSDNEIITSDNITFDGAAFVIKNNEFMLVDGTKATINGEVKISSTATVSVMKCKNSVSLSGGNDASVSVASDKVYRITDSRENTVGENTDALGITAVYKDGKLKVDMLAGFHSLKLVKAGSQSGIPITGY